MKNLNALLNLVNKLSKEELKSLMKYLKYYSDKSNMSKSIQFINLLIDKNKLTSIEFQLLLYKKSNQFAFNKLIDRLREKILEVILFDSNISKKHYPERAKTLFELKKKLIQCDILSLKGLRDDADIMCKKIISKAEKYEFFDIIINALIMRQKFIMIRKKQNEVKEIQEGIQITENKYKSIINSQIIYNSIINKMNNTSNSASYYQELIESIIKIENQFELYKTDLVEYFLYFLRTEFYQIDEKFDEAEKWLLKMQILVSKKSLFSDNRMGTTMLNLANNNIFLGKFNDAIKNALVTKKYIPNNIYNQAIVEETLFYANFYKGDYIEALKIINKLVSLPITNNIIFSMNKWNYLQAVMDFINKDYNLCIERLNNVDEFSKDKDGWNINKRLVLIMARIEVKEFESVDLQVANLEKFLKRNKKRREIRLRYIYILRVLIKLINSNYNFQETLKNRNRYFQLLNSETPDLKWKVRSPEMIEFVSWFKSKL